MHKTRGGTPSLGLGWRNALGVESCSILSIACTRSAVSSPDERGKPSELRPGNWLGAKVTTVVGGETSVTHQIRDSAWDESLLDITARYPDSLLGLTTNLVLAEL
jgi:hypothetical protein